jgi:hypothetical protein
VGEGVGVREETERAGDRLLLAELRDLTARLDGPPATLTANAKALYVLRDLDSALRELLAD